ncbi:MAG: SDR family oxidoreductase [Nitrospiraceae bacterium]
MSGQRLKGKVAVVTGASRGIGAAIAEHLGRDGASVVVNYVDSADKAAAVVRRIEADGSRAAAIQADVGKAADVQRLFDESIAKFGKVDILVNNAGVPLYKMVAEITEPEFDRILATNVKGVFLTCKQAVRRMPDGGRVINVSTSVTGLMLSTYVAYAATKGAVEQMTRHLAQELGRRGITVNAVSPGPTDTEFFGEGKTDADKQRFAQMAALGRLGQPADIADVVTFLASDEARWITGQNLRVNGGFI